MNSAVNKTPEIASLLVEVAMTVVEFYILVTPTYHAHIKTTHSRMDLKLVLQTVDVHIVF